MKLSFLLIIAALTLVACGGGGGGAPTSSAPSQPVPNPSNLTLEQPPNGRLPADLLPPQ